MFLRVFGYAARGFSGPTGGGPVDRQVLHSLNEIHQTGRRSSRRRNFLFTTGLASLSTPNTCDRYERKRYRAIQSQRVLRQLKAGATCIGNARSTRSEKHPEGQAEGPGEYKLKKDITQRSWNSKSL